MLFCRRTRTSSLSCVRSRPERINQPLRLSFGTRVINNSLNRFAATMSILRSAFQCRRSPNRKSTPRIPFRCAFVFAVEIETGSTSMANTRRAPKRVAARARMPLPVPRSANDQPLFHPRVNCSSSRSDIAVVACSPVPNALPPGITRSGGFPTAGAFGKSPFLEITSRFPILSGLLFSPSLSRFSHSRCNFSASPPNSSTSFRESFREAHAISSCNLLHPGLEMIASLPCERVCRIFSRALSQCGATAFRHRYMDWGSTRVSRVWRLPTLRVANFSKRITTCGVNTLSKACFGVTPKPNTRDACATQIVMSILFFLGCFFVLRLRHFLRQTGGVFFVFDIINRERPKHIVRVVPGPILVRIAVSHL